MAGRELIVRVVGNSSSFERSMVNSTRATNTFSHSTSRAERGALAGSGAFKAMGRSLAFASGGFLLFAAVTGFIRAAADEAMKGAATTRALGTALGQVGEVASAKLPVIKAWAVNQERYGVSVTTAQTGLARMIELTGSSARAMKAYTTAQIISKATGKGFNVVALAVGKAMNHQTTALSRYIGTIKKGTPVAAILARIWKMYGGQARANTTDEQRFGAALSNTKLLIGQGLLPIVDKYLVSGRRWLDQMNKTGKLQKDAATGAKIFADGIKGLADIIKIADKITGSFKHTLELLIALKVAKWAMETTAALELMASGPTARVAGRGIMRLTVAMRGLLAVAATSMVLRFPGLTASLARLTAGITKLSILKAMGRLVIPVVVGYVAARGFIALQHWLDRHVHLGHRAAQIPVTIPIQVKLAQDRAAILAAGGEVKKNFGVSFQKGQPIDWKLVLSVANAQAAAVQAGIAAGNAFKQALNQATGGVNVNTGTPSSGSPFAVGGALGAALDAASAAATGMEKKKKAADKALFGGATGGSTMSTKQLNTFFDNDISRLLLRGGLTNSITKQIAAIQQVDALIKARMAKTHDVTRRRNLEDQLMQHEFDIQNLRAQRAADAVQARADAAQKRADALKKRMAKLSASEFAMMGLGPTGDARVPTKRALKRELGVVGKEVKGTIFDTPKVERLLKSFGQVLSKGIVPPEVKTKIAAMLGNLNDQIDKNSRANLPKWKHMSSQAFLAGIPNLTPAQKRKLTQRYSMLGPGGTMPPDKALAFSGAGATVQVDSSINIDGTKVGSAVTKHQIKHSKKRTLPRGV